MDRQTAIHGMTALEYFQECVDRFNFVPTQFECEDKNLKAFQSKEEYKVWFGQGPGKPGEPYRDEAFYTREIAAASFAKKPQRIVEVGTGIGIGTVLLRILNPTADILTIDNRRLIPAADGKEYPAGFLADQNKAGHSFLLGTIENLFWQNVQFFFIDGDHSYEGVNLDSEVALRKSERGAIMVWHDYNDRHPGCTKAVDEFCKKYGFTLRKLTDSSTVSCILR